jgi:hypothetical protein
MSCTMSYKISNALGLLILCGELCRQAVGRRGRGRQAIDIHLLKPARFRPDPEWAVPPSDRDGFVHDEDLDPEPEWIT